MTADSDQTRMREELGFQRWEAVGHFLTDGDYLGFNLGDYRGAIAEYEKAWQVLFTSWQQETGGADILLGIADFALRSEDKGLAEETFAQLSLRASKVGNAALDEVLGKLKELAAAGSSE
jgi:hypothetical protein